MVNIISFINYKGGVGKSTTTYHVGVSLALDHELDVLLVDIDPQTNLTFLCAVPERWQDFKEENGTLASLYQAFLAEEDFDIEEIIWASPIERLGTSVVEGLDLIPSDVELLGIDLELQNLVQPSADLARVAANYVAQRTILRDALSEIADEYDYILIDCPPNLYLVTQNALAASDSYVVTTIPDHLSTIGLSILDKKVRDLAGKLRVAGEFIDEDLPVPVLEGIIFTRVRLGGDMITNVHRRKMEDLQEQYQGLVFQSYTTEGIGYSEAAEQALPVFLMEGTNPERVAGHYREITEEFVERFKS